MAKIFELKLTSKKDIYKQLAKTLFSFREQPPGSVLLIVEGTKQNPLIGIRYPGRKVRKRNLKVVRSNSALWANLFDFEVVPFKNRKDIKTDKLTFEELMRDFQENKKESEEFWDRIEEIYEKNKITKKPPELPGIDPLFYLLILKWIWIQEDFNYKLSWKEVDSPVPYVLETRTGIRTSRGAGRAKFFAALLLLKYYFDFEQVKKIIPLY